MTRLLAEQPTLLAILLVILGGTCVYGWLHSGRRALAVAGLACIALIPAGYLLAANWQTDREQIMELVYDTAAAVERNDAQAVTQVIDPAEPDIRERVVAEMTRYTFSRAQVGQFRSINFLRGADPPEVQVDITANATVGLRSEHYGQGDVSRRIVLRLRKKDDSWWVTEYTHLPVIGGPDGFTPDSELTRTYRNP
ncbi:hypothetical protein [Roseimaritima sediminicola]|uniref:hypothetical protein n=1 Tax=Roseimaritima sediminicola TaxID=2662066 RepID=UPI0012982FA4|nr:hypothetical protein [Roseimaritima sediminicola]